MLYLNEATEPRTNIHQTHMEALIMNGKDGINELNSYAEKIINFLTLGTLPTLNVSRKIDGSPAIIVGSHFSDDYPDNFVCLKSFVNGSKNCLASDEEIDAKYGDKPDLAKKLKYGLKLSKFIPRGEAWQGDCLFTKDELKQETIDGVDYLTFQPNTIVFAISEDDDSFYKVKNSDFGIAFHTVYKPIGQHSISQSFDPKIESINFPDNLFITVPALNLENMKIDLMLDSVKSLFGDLKKAEDKLLENSDYEELCNNKLFMGYWAQFENNYISDKQQIHLNANTIIADLEAFINIKLGNELNKKLATLKTDAGKEKAKLKFSKDQEEIIGLLDNKELFTKLANAFNAAVDLKMYLLTAFENEKPSYKMFYRSRTTSYIPTTGEGYSLSDSDGNIVKIVDRASFSHANRSDDIIKGFER